MRSFVAMAAFGLAVAISAATSQAATLNFTGNITSADLPFLSGGTFTLAATYGENTTGSTGTASASTFSAQRSGGGTLDYTKAGAIPFNLVFTKDGTNDKLSLTAAYTSLTTGQPSFGVLDLTFTRAGTAGSPLNLTTANVAVMLSGNSTYAGTFVQTNDLTNTIASATLGGTIPVPEPGSIGLLAGLGMFCGCRIYRRRQQKKAEAAV